MNLTEQARTGWDGVAEGYDTYVTPLVIPLAEEVLGRVDIRPGTRLLDVGAGSGALALAAARRGAHAVATDIAPGMIARLEARARDERLTNVESRVMDAYSLELNDDAFDVSASQLGVTVLPELRRALGEMVRVTKPGGHVVVVALGPPEKAEFLGFFLAALKASVPGFTGPPADPPPVQFQVADLAKFHERLVEARLRDISLDTITFDLEFPSARRFWDFLMSSNPMGRALVADLADEQRAEVQDVLAGMLRERSNGTGAAALSIDVNVAVAAK